MLLTLTFRSSVSEHRQKSCSFSQQKQVEIVKNVLRRYLF